MKTNRQEETRKHCLFFRFRRHRFAFTLPTRSKLILFYRSINFRWLLMLKTLWNQTNAPKFDWIPNRRGVFFCTFFGNKVNGTQSPFERPPMLFDKRWIHLHSQWIALCVWKVFFFVALSVCVFTLVYSALKWNSHIVLFWVSIRICVGGSYKVLRQCYSVYSISVVIALEIHPHKGR